MTVPSKSGGLFVGDNDGSGRAILSGEFRRLPHRRVDGWEVAQVPIGEMTAHELYIERHLLKWFSHCCGAGFSLPHRDSSRCMSGDWNMLQGGVEKSLDAAG